MTEASCGGRQAGSRRGRPCRRWGRSRNGHLDAWPAGGACAVAHCPSQDMDCSRRHPRQGRAVRARGALSMSELSAPDGQLVLQASGLERHYAVRRGMFRGTARAAGAARRELRAPCRAHARRGRRVRLRQEHARPPGHPDRAAERRPSRHRRHRRRGRVGRAAPPSAPHRADRVPGPLRLAQPAQEDQRDPGRAAQGQHRARRRRARGGGPGDDGPGRACGPSTTAATRTCSRAASASASRSPAR